VFQKELFAVTNHLDDQVAGVLDAGAERRLALNHVGVDEEQPAVAELGQRQRLVEVGDAAASREVLETRVLRIS